MGGRVNTRGGQPAQLTAKTTIRSRPSQNWGTDNPMRLTKTVLRSERPPGLREAMIPRGMESTKARPMPRKASTRVKRQFFEDDRHGRTVLPERIAEIQAGHVGHEIDELNPYGPVQAELPLKGGALLNRGFQGEHDLHRVPHHAGDHEHEHRDAEDHDDAVPETLQNVPAHPRVSYFLIFISLTRILASTLADQSSAC
jgi:hypothetical protein